MEDHYVSYALIDEISRGLTKQLAEDKGFLDSEMVGISRSGLVGLAIAADALEGMGIRKNYFALGSRLYDAHRKGEQATIYQTVGGLGSITGWDDVADSNATLDTAARHLREKGHDARFVIAQVKARNEAGILGRGIRAYGEMIQPEQWAFYEWKKGENEQSPRFQPENFGASNTSYRAIDSTARRLAGELRSLVELYAATGQKFKIVGLAPRGWLPAVVLSDELGCDRVYSVGVTQEGVHQIPPGGEGEIAFLVDGIPAIDDINKKAFEALEKEGYRVYRYEVPVGAALPNLGRHESG